MRQVLYKSPRLITPVNKPERTEIQCATGLMCSTGARVQAQAVFLACHSAIRTQHHGSGTTSANTHSRLILEIPRQPATRYFAHLQNFNLSP